MTRVQTTIEYTAAVTNEKPRLCSVVCIERPNNSRVGAVSVETVMERLSRDDAHEIAGALQAAYQKGWGDALD